MQYVKSDKLPLNFAERIKALSVTQSVTTVTIVPENIDEDLLSNITDFRKTSSYTNK